MMKKRTLFLATVGAWALVLSMGPGCGVDEKDGIEVVIAGNALGAAPEGIGSAIQLESGFLFLHAIELLPCGGETASLGAKGWLLRQVAMMGVRAAHASHGSSPTILEPTRSFGFLDAEGEAMEFGSLHPPPGRYCSVHILSSPAHHIEAGDPLGEGNALRLEGRVSSEEGWSPFLLEIPGAFERTLTFSPFMLEASATLVLDLQREGLFGEIEAGEPASMTDAVMDAVMSAWGARWD